MKENGKNMTVLYGYLSRKLSSGGISAEELDAIKYYPIGHSSVASFIELNMVAGNFVWRNHVLVNANRKIGVKLTPWEESRFGDKARKMNMSPLELATKIILEVVNS